MLSSLIAKIVYVGKKRINVEVNSFFYWINVKENNNFEISSKPKRIFCRQVCQLVHNEIRTEIYGFETIKEVDWFQSLLACQGIGPKTAMRIMKHDIDEIKRLIAAKNEAELSAYDGINESIAASLVGHA